MDFLTWAALAGAVLLLAALPGPSALLMVAQARALGLGAALVALAGDLLACALLVGLVGAGLGSALLAVPGLLDALRLVGFAWLAVLIWRGLRVRKQTGAVHAAPPGALFAQGFITCASNPKLILHLAAFLPLFLDPARPLAPQLAIVALTHVIIDGLVLGGWAVAATALGRLARN